MERVGFGYDSHRLAEGRPLVLGGVRVEHNRGLAGHSDADAVLHAIADAIYGAVAAGDIGEHFPDTDPKYKDADSSIFVRHAVKIAAEAGYRPANCDVTILAEQPRLADHKPAMRSNVAKLLGLGPECVSVKAKTNEHLGPIGRGEAIAAIAVVLMTAD